MEEKPIITIQNLNVTYFLGRSNEVQALTNISLDIYPGEFIIFFGPSGCGKSTLLYSIAGLETHAQGSIMVADKNIAKLKKHDIEQYRQKNIGMIFQAFYLINSLSVLKNVTLPQIAIQTPLHERNKRALTLLERFGVKDQAHKLPNELSGGQQQRIAICRALINDPEILFADEPVGNLDSKSSGAVMKLLSQLNEEQQKTIVLVTHDPSHLNLAHRVFYMKDGTIIETRVNRPLRKTSAHKTIEAAQAPPPSPAAQGVLRPSLSKELELLIRTYSSIAPGQIGTMLIPFKAKQIVSEALTGLTIEEIEKIEAEVRHLMMSRLQDDPEELTRYLDTPVEQGGLGLDKRTAEKLGESIETIISEVKRLQKAEHEGQITDEHTTDPEIISLRHYLLEAFDVRLTHPTAVANFDNLLRARLKNLVGPDEVIRSLDQDPHEGGVGLDRRIARRIAKRLELVLLGKYGSQP